MTDVSELDLAEVDLIGGELTGERYHEQLAGLTAQGKLPWLARSPLAYVVLDRESGEFFLRSRQTAFPGREIADLFGVTSGPLREQIDANILNQRGDLHRRLRALIGPAFTPRAADKWRPAMREFLAQLWEPVSHGQAFDFVAAIAKPYPALTIARRPGRPAGRRAPAPGMVGLGPAAVRHPGAGQPGRADGARRHRGLRLRGGPAGPAAGRAGRGPAHRAAGGRAGGGPAVPRGVREPGAERDRGRDRHDGRPARSRAADVRRAPRSVGAARPSSRAGPEGGRGGAAVRADHAVHGPDLPGAGRAPGRAVPGGHDRGRLLGARQPGAGRRRAVRHHGGAGRAAAHLRRRAALLPGREPGPGRAGGGAGLPGPAPARAGRRRPGGAGRPGGHVRCRVTAAALVAAPAVTPG